MRRDERFTVGERSHVDLEVPSGSVLLQTGMTGVVALSIDSADASEYDMTQIGDTIAIRHNARWLSRSRSARIVVECPARTDVTLKGASVDIAVRGLFGAVRTRTASGDLEVDEVERLESATTSGDARVALVHGDAHINTTSGDVTVREARGRLTATMSSGDVRADLVGGDLAVGSSSGDVDITRCDGSDLSIKTVSGNIRVGLPAGIRVDPDIATMSGRVVLPKPASADPSVERRSVKVRLQSVSGDIRIERVD